MYIYYSYLEIIPSNFIKAREYIRLNSNVNSEKCGCISKVRLVPLRVCSWFGKNMSGYV